MTFTGPMNETDVAESTAHRTLATTQLGILSAELQLGDPSAYTVVSAVRFTGVPDRDALLNSIIATLGRHDVLTWRPRLSASFEFEAVGGIGTRPGCRITEVDFPTLEREEEAAIVGDRVNEERQRVIRLFASNPDPFVFMTVFHSRAAAGTGYCIFTAHHIFVDEHSVNLLWDEVFHRVQGHWPNGDYDARFAAWAAGTQSEGARKAATAAAEEIIRGLGSAPRLQLSVSTASSAASVHRFAVPGRLTGFASQQARDWGVPPSALYGRAAMAAVSDVLGHESLSCTMAVTRRSTLDELRMVGCFVASVPVVASGRAAARLSRADVFAWDDAVNFSASRAHAGIETLYADKTRRPPVALAFDAPIRTKRLHSATWQMLPLPDSTPKSPLAIFLAPASRGRDGEGRVLWRLGTLDRTAGRMFEARFSKALKELLET